ncbi:MAG: hypothetical protein HY867_09720 [Chloroflexi bacterium]|nr:hypothetical protein [Chloroflexota bacterium]
MSNLKRLGNGVWSGVLFVWNRPLIMIVILSVAVYFVFAPILAQAFKFYATCDYLILNQLGLDPMFCNGHMVRMLGIPVFTVPALRTFIDLQLEMVRSAAAWGVVISLAVVSLLLTSLVNNFKAVLRILIFNKEEWRRLLASARTWLLIFVALGLAFYFGVMR